MNRWAKALLGTAWVSGIFCLLVLGGLAANALVARGADPNPPTRIDTLVTRLKLDAKNEKAREELRRQDVWLREGYLRSQRFALRGGFLLLGGVAVFLLSLKGARKLASIGPQPDPEAPSRFGLRTLNAQQGTLTLGLVLGGGLAVVATLSRHDANAAYFRGVEMPQVAAGTKKEEPKGEALTVLPPPVAIQPEPLKGDLPAQDSTELVPMPVTPPTPQPSTPPKKVEIAPPVMVKGSWPMFRGPALDGVAVGDAPTEWDGAKGKGVLWKTAVPLPGLGSPVVWGGKVFLAGADAKTREVYGFDATAGKLLWQTKIPLLPTSGPMKQSNDTGYAPATIATDAKRLVAVFVNGDVVCLDHDGKILWQLAFGKLENMYGHASSPVIAEGKLILQIDEGTSPEGSKSRILALDPATGKSLWQIRRPVSASWSTPLPLKVDGREILVTASNPLTIAHDLLTGKEIWRAEGLAGDVSPSPAAGEGLVFVAEMGAGIFAVGAGDGKQLWTNSEVSLPDISSPVCAEGIVFMTGPSGEVTAVDAKDGKMLWSHPFENPARSSPIVVGKNVYLVANDGTTHVFSVGREFKLIATNPLGESVGSTPAVVDGRIYIRGDRNLYCIGEANAR